MALATVVSLLRRPAGGQGIGLGLTAARGVARRYGRKIEASSEPGRGATFTVTLVAGRRPAAERDPGLEEAMGAG